MGKITSALKKAAEERMGRLDKISKIYDRKQVVFKEIGKSRIDPNIITYFDPKALMSEQYKILRTNLLSMNKGKPPRLIVITSAIHSEGKTVTALNLAVSLAQAINKPKVLLVDADLRRGRVKTYMGIFEKAGLTEILKKEIKLQDAVYNLDIENLYVVISGGVPENPAELLASNEMRHFLSKVKSEFDFVLIDTPPIISVTDSGILGSQVEGVILVVQAGRTQRGIVKRAEELLHQSHSKILGHILTKIEYHLPEYIYRYL